jgi:hypothetical protein
MTAIIAALAEQIARVEMAKLALREEMRKLEELQKKVRAA